MKKEASLTLSSSGTQTHYNCAWAPLTGPRIHTWVITGPVRDHVASLVIVVPPWPWAVGTTILLKTEALGNSFRLLFVTG